MMPIKLLLAFALLTFPAASFGQLKVIMSGGFSAAYQEIVPEFEKSTGITVATTRGPSQGDSPNAIGAQLRRGVVADMVIMSREGLEPLLAEGRFVPGTVVDLVQVPLGMSVRAGAPIPDIRTVEAFTQTLLRAKLIGMQSTSAIYLTTTVFPKLGIAGALSGKLNGSGAAAVARGESELTILPVSELLHVPGTEFAGTIPAEIQRVMVFSAALLKGSQESVAAKRLISLLSSESATKPIRKFGMEPMTPASKR
ncbi:MAG: substrate-binding domain-containing protein [Acidobacteriota bacterium]